METTSISLRWHLTYMMKYPEYQDKVRKEIFDVVGTNRLPSMSDKPNMPYTQAVIHEVQRHSNMVPILGTHFKFYAVLEKTIPFSIGKRNCLGEGLARMELFLIFNALIQKYEFVPKSSIDLSPVWGGALTSKPYKCQLIPQIA
ncbi:hypothetical protein B9Z55_017723 [Caenorhabditis nigoni]|uniref:Uncharacterized protein n=1 Tax=Caenorhabditis nigoni TaxID=1611254 RepID=A0A2G5TAP9_9PELO|nr:hypothetical protein B9Z55_017723 [Caenorhabditis nigoni]